jgi:hypothetical protein
MKIGHVAGRKYDIRNSCITNCRMKIVLMLQNSNRWLSRHKVKYPGIEEILSKYKCGTQQFRCVSTVKINYEHCIRISGHYELRSYTFTCII